ncbi:hypothetical protein [Rhizobium mayense]|uniref:DUF1834 family protein n=1 Tax=Rhizobium mayense TaxID=1312184 RepID=A0ABT7K278_9HYPH|nr:hypothetical protein [Rhizobium mayense]MDL2401254.1 hypothetical protein [Rhizobium mayense]
METSYAPIRTMEPAIIDRLRLAFPSKTFKIDRVPQNMTLTEFDSVTKTTPFIGLAWVGMRTDPDAGRRLKGQMLWRLVLIYKSSRALIGRFKGDALDIGLDAMADVATIMLHGVTFPGIGACRVTAANSIVADGFAADDIVLAQVDFEIAFTANVNDLKLEQLEDFRTLGMTWTFADDPDAPTVSAEINIPQTE